jgi:hypothetical protein
MVELSFVCELCCSMLGFDGGKGTAYEFVRTSGVWSNGTALTLASGLSGGDQFGASVALSGDGSTALVGAPNTNSNTGAAYFFN